MKKVILDLCGGTGAWSKPYRDAGYDVRLVTIPDNDVRYFEPPDEVYGILAAPPCTMFSLARQNAKLPRDMKSAMEIVEACLKIIWKSQYDQKQKIKFWAMENPRGYLRRFMGKPAFTFEQWMFDASSSHCKPTDIWGNFVQPKLLVKDKPELQKNRNRRTGNWQKPIPPAGYEHVKSRAAIRSITPQGFANAFFQANK